MELVVVDSSVAVKWVIYEADTPIANEILVGPARMFAPAIIRWEVAGAALWRYRTGVFDRQSTEDACARWEEVIEHHRIQLVPIDELFEKALRLAIQCRHTIPDCLFLAAAITLNCPLLTADATLFERAQSVYPYVRMLAKAA